MQSEELPWGGAYRGHEGARALFAKLDLSLQSTLEIERYIRAGDSIAAVGWTQGTVNATGGVYRIPIVHLWKLANGLIERAQFLIDHPAMQNALGSRSN
jgi:ketosteroid isomerase-like protein